MKACATRISIKDLLGAPVHYGRPHTPDDQAWIEAFIKTLKYHRERPLSFHLVDDVVFHGLTAFRRFITMTRTVP